MMPTSLAAAVAPRTGKISFFWKRRKFATKWYTTNGILHFEFKLSQSSEIVLQS